MAQTFNYDLSNNISVKSGFFEAGADVTVNSTKVASGTKTSVIEDKKGLLFAGEKDGEYSFKALSGGNFTFTDGLPMFASMSVFSVYLFSIVSPVFLSIV